MTSGDLEKKKSSDSLTGQLLLAMPGMGDPRFHKAAIFLCMHGSKGAMGFVINHAVPGIYFSDLLKQLDIESDIIVPQNIAKKPVMSGGPVETARGFLLHSNDFKTPDTIHVDDNFGVTGTLDALQAVAKGSGPKKTIFTLGYAGWGPNQLEQEIQQNAWLSISTTQDLLFNTPPDAIWTGAIASLGIDPGMLSTQSGQA